MKTIIPYEFGSPAYSLSLFGYNGFAIQTLTETTIDVYVEDCELYGNVVGAVSFIANVDGTAGYMCIKCTFGKTLKLVATDFDDLDTMTDTCVDISECASK